MIKEIFGGHPLAANIYCVDSLGKQATPSFSHPIELYKWLNANGYREVPRSDARHDHVLGVYERCTASNTGEHVIAYAYPTSEASRELGCERTGCYTLQAKGKATAHKTFNQAVRAAEELGTTPGPWSMDHPKHAKHYQETAAAAQEVAV